MKLQFILPRFAVSYALRFTYYSQTINGAFSLRRRFTSRRCTTHQVTQRFQDGLPTSSEVTSGAKILFKQSGGWISLMAAHNRLYVRRIAPNV